MAILLHLQTVGGLMCNTQLATYGRLDARVVPSRAAIGDGRGRHQQEQVENGSGCGEG